MFGKKVVDGAISNLKVRSLDNVTDIFAKSLTRASFKLLHAKLGLILKTITLRGSVKN